MKKMTKKFKDKSRSVFDLYMMLAALDININDSQYPPPLFTKYAAKYPSFCGYTDGFEGTEGLE